MALLFEPSRFFLKADDDQSIPWSKHRGVTSSSFSELMTTQLREFHMVSPQVVFTLLIFLTMQSYKFYLKTSYIYKHTVREEVIQVRN